MDEYDCDEFGIFSTKGISDEELERREARHVRELRRQRDELLSACEYLVDFIVDIFSNSSNQRIGQTERILRARASIARARKGGKEE
jgi:hypothetical protein